MNNKENKGNTKEISKEISTIGINETETYTERRARITKWISRRAERNRRLREAKQRQNKENREGQKG